MQNNPLVSVIIACYNAENYIDICLESIVNQTYKNLEILICDDCSTDGSYSKLIEWQKKDERIVLLKNDRNMFSADTRNKCIEASHGEYLMIQDIDDLSRLDRVEVLLNALICEEVDFISSEVAIFKDDYNNVEYYTKTKNRKPSKWCFLWGITFPHAATMFSRRSILTVKGYRVAPETRRNEDYDMFMRLYFFGYKGAIIEDALYYYRVDYNTIGRRTFDARIDEYKVRKMNYKALKMMPWAFPFIFKPFVAHIVQKVKYRNISR